jgi:hypothetical protein
VSHYKLVGTTNPNTNWSSEVIIKGEEEGDPNVHLVVGQPVELTDEQRNEVEALGFVVVEASDEEVESHDQQVEESSNLVVGEDVTGSGPVFAPSSTRKDN